MMCYDALVAPAVLQLQHGKFATKHRQLNKRKAAGHQADGQPALMFKLQRMLFTALAVVLYIKSRTLLAGNQVRFGRCLCCIAKKGPRLFRAVSNVILSSLCRRCRCCIENQTTWSPTRRHHLPAS